MITRPWSEGNNYYCAKAPFDWRSKGDINEYAADGEMVADMAPY